MAIKTLAEVEGGGGGLPVNTIMYINSTDSVFTEADGSVWLQEGFIETNLSLYPDATVITSFNGYTGNSFSTATEISSESGLTWDGTHFWILDSNDSVVHQYTNAGVFTGTTFSAFGQISSTGNGLTWDGTNFWVLDQGADVVFQYSAAGSYTGTSFSFASEDTNGQGITWDGTNLWIIGGDNDTAYEYTTAGVYTGNSFSVGSQDTVPAGIGWDGTYFYVIGLINDRIFQYTSDGVYTGFSQAVGAQDGNMVGGIAYDGNNLFIAGTTSSAVFEYELLVGNGISATSGDYTYYVKVK